MDKLEHTIWEKALKLLSLRAHSRQELKTKLAARFPEHPDAVASALDELERVELLNDRRFTELFIASLIQRPIGRIKIGVETRRRGLNPELVDQWLLNLNWNEIDSARRALDEKNRTLREVDPRKRKMKLVNFLRSRGFREATIYKVI